MSGNLGPCRYYVAASGRRKPQCHLYRFEGPSCGGRLDACPCALPRAAAVPRWSVPASYALWLAPAALVLSIALVWLR